MAGSNLPPVPYQTPMNDQKGILTQPWAGFFRQLLSLVGGTSVTYPITIANGGTGQTTQQAALDALTGVQGAGKYVRSDGTHSTLSTIQAGDLPLMTGDSGTGGVKGAVPAPAAGDASAGKFLKADGTWSAPASGSGSVTSVSLVSANGFSGTVANASTTPAITLTTSVTGILKGNGTAILAATAADFPTLNQNTTGTAGGLSSALPLSGLATQANNTVVGNVSGSAAAPTALTQTQLTALVNAFTPTLSGAVPASGGGTTNYLRADGTWAAPSSSTPVYATATAQGGTIASGAYNIVKYQTAVDNASGAYSTTTGQYTAQASRPHRVKGTVEISAVWSANGAIVLGIYKNGVATGFYGATTASASFTGSLIATVDQTVSANINDLIDVRVIVGGASGFGYAGSFSGGNLVVEQR